jgi:hypothetical protein
MITITNKTKTVLLGLSFVTVGLVLAESAQAASLTGPGKINFAGEVNITVDDNGTLGDPTDDSFVINFDPKAPTSNIAILNEAAAIDGFEDFGVGASVISPNTGVIEDLEVPFIVPPAGTDFPVANFLQLNTPGTTTLSGTGFNLEKIGQFNFAEIEAAGGGVSTIISTTVSGHWFNDLGELFGGTITFSTQVDGQDLATVQAALFAGTLGDLAYSAEGDAFEKVPEPSAMLALMSVFGAGLFVKKGRNAK